MNAPRHAENVSRLLASARRGDGPPPSAESRAHAISAIEGALRAKRAKVKRRRIMGLSLAVAAALVVGLGVSKLHTRSDAPLASTGAPVAPAPVAVVAQAPAADITMIGHPTGSGATVESEGHSTPLVDGARLAKGSRVVARADGGVTLALSTGTKLSMSEGAQLAVESEGPQQIFALTSGSVRAEVAKLVGNQRFVVRTPDTEVEVHGTVFRVSQVTPDAACGDGTPTRVTVTEGIVAVRHAGVEVNLRAGDSWPRGCVTPRASVASSPVRASMPRRHFDPVPASEVNTPSRLAEQNDLFARGKASRRSGATGDAVAQFDELIRRYPGGPLTEAASVERMRTLRGSDPARAESAAREYLRRFPSGFAREEAQAILSGADR